MVMTSQSAVLPRNLVVLSATQGLQISASSPEKGHGVFTYYFLTALKDGKKDIAEIYEYHQAVIHYFPTRVSPCLQSAQIEQTHQLSTVE